MRPASQRPPARPARRGLLLLALATGACDTCSPTPDQGQSPTCERTSYISCPCGDGRQKPFRDDWELLVDAAFPLTGDDAIHSLTLGRLEQEGNWGNRGDIEVYFDLPEARVTIELRRYTHAECEEDAQQIFESMYLWAATAETPTIFNDLGDASCLPLIEDRPGKLVPDDATDGSLRWRDDCRVNYYYDGQTSPQRAGADMRVHLPAGYRGHLAVTTSDNDVEDDYPLRGDIDVRGLCGSAELRLSNGHARVALCDALSPAPTCTTEQVESCVAAGWDPACGCDEFGALDVRANPATGPDITVDLPEGLFARVSLDNEQEGAAAGELTSCPAIIENCDQGCELTQDPETPWAAELIYNDPGPPAPDEAGYRVTALAERCQAVPEVEGPDEWLDGVAPDATRRGFTRLCTGCL